MVTFSTTALFLLRLHFFTAASYLHTCRVCALVQYPLCWAWSSARWAAWLRWCHNVARSCLRRSLFRKEKRKKEEKQKESLTWAVLWHRLIQKSFTAQVKTDQSAGFSFSQDPTPAQHLDTLLILVLELPLSRFPWWCPSEWQVCANRVGPFGGASRLTGAHSWMPEKKATPAQIVQQSLNCQAFI